MNTTSPAGAGKLTREEVENCLRWIKLGSPVNKGTIISLCEHYLATVAPKVKESLANFKRYGHKVVPLYTHPAPSPWRGKLMALAEKWMKMSNETSLRAGCASCSNELRALVEQMGEGGVT